ncbi:MAG TPA: glycosyltransferase family 4 protein [Burkholderiales bacterium]|nr:glycosyltransferase family 4 protein [Burkholderiales bacterium]
MQPITWAPLTAFAAALFVIWWLVNSRFSGLALDRPNPRSLHEIPVPRTGGIGMHVGILLALGLIAPNLPITLATALGLLYVISLLDDIRGVAARWRLIVHLIAASGFSASVLLDEHGLITVLITSVAIAWMANLYNFMDGSDGLAGGMAISGFSFYGIAAWFAGSTEFALVNFSIAAAAAAFLVFNFPPARVFMGDVGSVPLGFLAGALGVIGWVQRDWTWWFPVLVFSPFIVDATVTLARRALRGERVWQAHREHYYQHMVQLGLGHRRTALSWYGLMLAVGVTALWGLQRTSTGQALLLAAWLAIYAVMMVIIDRRWSNRQKGTQEQA